MDQINFIVPEAYGHNLERELHFVPRTSLTPHAAAMTQQSKSITTPPPPRQRQPSDPLNALKRKLESNGSSVTESVKPQSAFPLPSPGSPDAFDRRQLLLSIDQMNLEGVPLPSELLVKVGKSKYPFTGFLPSKDVYSHVTTSSPMFALDCEMVITQVGSELARVTMVDENGEVVFDRLVKPLNPVEDYVTKYSGITRAMLGPIETQLPDVQAELRQLLPSDAILVGHSISGDLKAMNIFHPYLIDTSVIYNLKGSRRGKNKLKFLSEHFLGRLIQTGSKGHSSAEDAIATMDLVRLKLSQDISFGDVMANWRFPEGYNDHFNNSSNGPGFISSSNDIPQAPNLIRCYRHLQTNLPKIPIQFRPKLIQLLADYKVNGGAVDFCQHLLTPSGIDFALPTSDSEASKEAADALIDNYVADGKRYILTNITCPSEWSAKKQTRRLTGMCNQLAARLLDYSLVLLLCSGRRIVVDPLDSESKATRTGYIGLVGGSKTIGQNTVTSCDSQTVNLRN